MSVMGLSASGRLGAGFDPSTAADLRRRNRDLAEEIVARAEHLDPVQRELVRAVFRDGRPAKEIAVLLGAPSRAVRFRLHRIVQRIMTDEYLFVARNIHKWSETRRQVALATFINGLTLRAAAEQLGMSIHAVRRHHQAVIVLYVESRR